MIEVKTPLHYLVYESYDRSTTNVARFRSKFEADVFVKEHTNKNYLRVTEVQETKLFICESTEEFAELIEKQERETALAKLTDRERQLLGL